MGAAEDIAERRNEGPMKYIGLMQQGKENHLIRDHQVADLAQVREQVMAKKKVNQVSKIIEDQFRGLVNPDRMTVPLRDPIDLKEYRLDAYDELPNVPTYRLNDSSSDSGRSLKSDTNPEVCWETLEWIK